MELSNLTICRQDVIVVSDSETQGNHEMGSKRKRKSKSKKECVRKVQLTRMTMERAVPSCYRKRCRSAHHYHRRTSKNTKYTENGPRAAIVDRKTCKSKTNNIHIVREANSSITVKSSSDTYEEISSFDFNTPSSDSDELEELIKLTRKRMRNEKKIFNGKPQPAVCTANTQDNHPNNMFDDSTEGSIHSMDTVVLQCEEAIYSPISSYAFSEDDNNNEDIGQMLSCSPNHELVQSKAPSLPIGKSICLSPLYEISGKVFMEHYLNTSI